MRRGLVIGGVVLLVIGILVAGGGYALNAGRSKAAIPAGQVLVISPTGLSGGPFSGSWSGAPGGTTVYITTHRGSCLAPSGVVATSSGSNGSVSVTLSIGTTYYVFACDLGTPTTITMTYTYNGLSYFVFSGIVLAVLGGILLGVGAAAKPKSPPAGPTSPMPPAGISPPK
ncbi:MAG: hypothetical protein ACYCPN_04490 [Thermoplasmata archaeon]